MELTGIPWSQLGWGAIVVLVVMLIIRGDLVPRKVHDEQIKQLSGDRDAWRSIAETQRETIDNYLEVGRTSAHVIGSIPHATAGGEANATAEPVA